MLIVMKTDATERANRGSRARHQRNRLSRATRCPAQRARPSASPAIRASVDITPFESLPGVAEAIRVSKPYKLISLDLRPEKTVVRVGDAKIGGDELAIIAGPCADREPRAGFRDRRNCKAQRRAIFPRRRFQAPHFAICLSGTGRRRVEVFSPKCARHLD